MRYVMLIYESDANIEARAQPGHDYLAAWRAYHRALTAAGAYVSGAPIGEAALATTVRMKADKRRIQDGPFAEAKDQLGGFMIVDLPSLDAALEWAARCPAAATGAVEVRPMDVAFHDAVAAP